MAIRFYKNTDEPAWIKCRVLSFMDTSYFDDVKRKKDVYKEGDINLVAVEDNQVVAFMDIEVEEAPNSICYLDGKLGAVIWDLGVLPDYRKHGLASQMLKEALELLKAKDIKRLQAWTQDDQVANAWYVKHGFKQKHVYLNVFGHAQLDEKEVGPILGIRQVNFEADIKEKDRLLKHFKRVHEVRLYEMDLE